MEKGGFFAVDRRAWAAICRLGVNQAISFLVMARGTGGDNRTTSWSVKAVEQRTSISRPMAKAAIRSILDAKLAELIVGGTRPRYKLAVSPAAQEPAAPLKAPDKRLLDRVRQAGNLVLNGRNRDDLARASILVAKKLLVKAGTSYSLAPLPNEAGDPQWIWLPNALVDGLGAEIPPIELLWQSNSLDAIRMLVDLYAEHDIRDDAGMPWRPEQGIHQAYSREKLNERGEYVVWGFTQGNKEGDYRLHAAGRYYDAHETWDGFWDTIGILRDIGLIHFVAHLVKSHDAQGEVIHSLPLGRTGEPVERQITQAAHRAAESMLVPGTGLSNFHAIAPVKRHMRGVQLVGIMRLRYRPQTSATEAWIQKAAKWERWADVYKALGDRYLGSTAAQRPLQHQG